METKREGASRPERRRLRRTKRTSALGQDFSEKCFLFSASDKDFPSLGVCFLENGFLRPKESRSLSHKTWSSGSIENLPAFKGCRCE